MDKLPFPTKGGGVWWPTDKEVKGWQYIYTRIDVEQEIRKAHAWIEDNPSRKKNTGRDATIHRRLAETRRPGRA